MMTHSHGTNGFGYHINKNNVEKIISYNNIDKIIKSTKRNLTEDENFLIKVYENSKKNNEESLLDVGIYLKDYRKIVVQ